MHGFPFERKQKYNKSEIEELKCGEIILNLNSVRIKEKCINKGVPFGFVEVCGRR